MAPGMPPQPRPAFVLIAQQFPSGDVDKGSENPFKGTEGILSQTSGQKSIPNSRTSFPIGSRAGHTEQSREPRANPRTPQRPPAAPPAPPASRPLGADVTERGPGAAFPGRAGIGRPFPDPPLPPLPSPPRAGCSGAGSRGCPAGECSAGESRRQQRGEQTPF